MNTVVLISFRGIEASPAIEEYVRQHATRLEALSDCMTHCHVAVEAPHHRHRHGDPHRVRIEMTVAGARLVAGDRPCPPLARQGLFAVIEDAFEDAGHVLENYLRQPRVETNVRTQRDKPIR